MGPPILQAGWWAVPAVTIMISQYGCVDEAGFEPALTIVSGWRSTWLSYTSEHTTLTPWSVSPDPHVGPFRGSPPQPGGQGNPLLPW